MTNSYKESIIHGDSSFPFKVYFNKTEGGYSYYSHWHLEAEIILMLDGSISIYNNFDKITLEKKDIFFIDPEAIHDIKEENNKHASWLAFVFDLDILKNDDRVYLNYIEPIKNHSASCTNKIHYQNEYLYDLLIKLAEIYTSKKKFYEIKIKSILYDVFYELYNDNCINDIKKENDKTIIKLKEALDFISKNYHEQIFTKDIATSVFLNEFYFMKFFKKHMNITVNDYLTKYRLDKACGLLLSSNRSIIDIAYSVGFNSSSYFIKQFKKTYGITPCDYRKKHE